MIQELFQLYADRWQFFLKLTLQHLEISLIAIVAALCKIGRASCRERVSSPV